MRKICFLLLIVPFFLLGQEENSSNIINVTHIKVKVGHEAQFAEGVRLYKECYAESGGEDTWNFWRRVQGTGSVYAVTDMMENWAEMDDENDEAGNKCRSLFPDFIMPHIEKIDRMISESIPEVSNDSNEPKDKVWVTYFRVNNSKDFMDVVKAVSGAVKNAEGDERGYWYAVMGGSTQSPDYMVAWAFDKYADLDKNMDGVWKVYEKANGKKKTEEMRETFRASIDDSWSYIYDKSDGMSKTE